MKIDSHLIPKSELYRRSLSVTASYITLQYKITKDALTRRWKSQMERKSLWPSLLLKNQGQDQLLLVWNKTWKKI